MNATPDDLASAYLDGELTDDERRIAEADPAVMAEVEVLRALRERLAAVEPPSTATRDAAIAAAMGEFHQIHGATTATPPPPAAAPRREPLLPFRRRPAFTPWLGVAAAVLIVGLLGLIVTSGLRGGDDDSIDVASDAAFDEPAEEPADDAGSGEGRLTEAEVDMDAPVAADMADEPAMAAADSAADEMAAEPADEPAEDAEAGDAPFDTAVSNAVDPSAFFSLAGQPSDGRPITPIRSGDQLTDAADYLIELAVSGELPATPETACPYPVFADSAVLLAPDEIAIPVHVAVLPDDNLVVAIDIETCAVVLDAPIER